MIYEFRLYNLICDGENCHAPLSSGTFNNVEDMRHHAYARGWHSKRNRQKDYGYDYFCPECSKKLGLDV